MHIFFFNPARVSRHMMMNGLSVNCTQSFSRFCRLRENRTAYVSVNVVLTLQVRPITRTLHKMHFSLQLKLIFLKSITRAHNLFSLKHVFILKIKYYLFVENILWISVHNTCALVRFPRNLASQLIWSLSYVLF